MFQLKTFWKYFSHTILICVPNENNIKGWESLVYFILKYLILTFSYIWAPSIYTFSGIMDNFNLKSLRNQLHGSLCVSNWKS